MTVAGAIALAGVVVFLAHLFAVVFNRTRVPDTLMLIAVGVLLGPIMGLVKPSQFGLIGPILTTVTLVIMLFEAGTELELRVLRSAMREGLTLAAGGFLVTMLGVGGLLAYTTQLGPAMSLMMGAIVGSTSPAVILPLIRQLDIREESRAVLFLESAASDVFSIVVALTLLEGMELGKLRLGLMAGRMIASFVLAGVVGAVSGIVWAALLNRVRSLKNSIFTTPAFVFVVFGVVEYLGFSGYIAAVAFGITLGNIDTLHMEFLSRFIPEKPLALIDAEKSFFAEVVFLLKTFFFVYLGLSITLSDPWRILFGVALTSLIFLLRIVVVRLSVAKAVPAADASFMAVMAPKGLAAVVLASLALQAGLPGGQLTQDIAYDVVIVSVIFTSALVFLLDRTPFSRVYGWFFAGFGPVESAGEVE